MHCCYSSIYFIAEFCVYVTFVKLAKIKSFILLNFTLAIKIKEIRPNDILTKMKLTPFSNYLKKTQRVVQLDFL